LGSSDVVCVRLDWEYVHKLEQLAKSRGLDRSKLIRQIIIQYLDSQQLENTPETTSVKEVLDRSIKAMETLVDNVIKYCEDHAKEIVARRSSKSELFWKNECLSRRRGLVREKLLEIIRNTDKQLELYLPSYDQRRPYLKQLYQKVDQYMSKLQI